MPPSRANRAIRLGSKLAVTALVAAAVQFPLSAHASTSDSVSDSVGSDFWVAFPTNGGGNSTTLYISGSAAGTGLVAVPGQDWSQEFSVTPGSVTSVTVPLNYQVSQEDGVQNLGIHVSATTDVAVYGVNQGMGTSGAYLGLPTDSLGQRYRVLGYSGSTQLTVVATSDDTDVTVTPKSSVGTRTAATPYTVELDEGQTYQLSQWSGDVTGSVIEASAPVAVFGGGSCSNVPNGYGYCDHLVQQLPPTSAWGTDFLSVRFATRLKGDTYRVLANEDDTVVSVNGSEVGTIDAGEYWESVLPTGMSSAGSEGVQIHTSKPTLVAQYGNGTTYDNSTGDPLMMLVPPAGQYLNNYTVAAPSVSGYHSYVSLVVPTSDVGNVELDGAAVSSEAFSVIGDSDYSGAQLPVSSATHSLTGPNPFSVQVYEWGDYDGFGFPGAMELKKIYVDPQDPLSAINLTSTGTAPDAQQATVTIPEGGSATLLDGDTEVDHVTLEGIGTYTINSETGVITFTPVAGYYGTPDPVTFQITDGEDTATGTYTPTVNAPAAPAPDAKTSTGQGTTPQSVSVSLGEGESIALLDGEDEPVNEVVVDGVGTYVVNPETGVITFVADAGYTGTPEGVTYQVTDIYAQTGTATYTPTVTAPAAPTAPPKTSQGQAGGTQSASVEVPTGGSAALLNGDEEVLEIVIDGEGTYTIDPETGVITFVPAKGFTGKGDGVTYVVTDAYGQSAQGTYRPTVKAIAHVPAAKLKLTAPALVKLAGHHRSQFAAHCVMTNDKASVCGVQLTARVNGDLTTIGGGTAKAPAGARHVMVKVHLTKLGKALALRPGGVKTVAWGEAKAVKGKNWVRSVDRTRVVTKVTPIARPVHFDISSSTLRDADKEFLAQLRGKLAGVKQIVCAGYTDSSGNGDANKALGLARAKSTCDFLAGKLHVRTKVVSFGEARPTAPNDTEAGRALNRRAEVKLRY